MKTFTIPEIPDKSRVFISYHHKKDQRWFDEFNKLFADTYEVFTRHSLDHKIDSNDKDYIKRKIADEYIKNSSITIVLCGVDTSQRCWVAWEIEETLKQNHALLGIPIPIPRSTRDLPKMLQINIDSGYAIQWPSWVKTPIALKSAIQEAILASKVLSHKKIATTGSCCNR